MGKLRPKSSFERKSRGIPQRDVSKILIITEGFMEESYFRALKSHYRRKIEIKAFCSNKGQNPLNIVKFAIEKQQKYKITDEIKSTWCVFDIDNNTRDDLDKALSLSRKNKLEIALSNPCFEVWLLMHYERSTAPIHPSQKAKTLVKSKIPVYDCTKSFFQDNVNVFNELVERLDVAIKNSEIIDKQDYENPSTQVYKLIKEIKCLIQQ